MYSRNVSPMINTVSPTNYPYLQVHRSICQEQEKPKPGKLPSFNISPIDFAFIYFDIYILRE